MLSSPTAKLRPSHAGVASIYLHIFTCTRPARRRPRSAGGGVGRAGAGIAHGATGKRSVGPVVPYLASLSVFPLPGLSRLPKCRRHVCSLLENLCTQCRFRTASAAGPRTLPEISQATSDLEPPTSSPQPIQRLSFRKYVI